MILTAVSSCVGSVTYSPDRLFDKGLDCQALLPGQHFSAGEPVAQELLMDLQGLRAAGLSSALQLAPVLQFV